jgi:hypothetical protein
VDGPYFLYHTKRWEEYLSSLRTIASYNNTALN